MRLTSTRMGWGEEAPNVNRPFVFMPRSGTLDPRDWLPPLALGSVYPVALNDSGEMVIRGNTLVGGRQRWFLLSPGPQE